MIDTSKELNNQLLEIYRNKFINLAPILNKYNESASFNEKATNPFLLKVTENYFDFKNRIMVFGQETNTWCYECGNNSVFSNNIDKSIEVYKVFYLDGGINHYRGPFWNEFKRIKKTVSKSNNSVVIWNNINKIGRIGKGNVHSINEIQFEYFNVIRDEIKLLKPNIVIFLTGHDYDFFIRKNIGNFNQIKIKDNLFELEFENDYGVSKYYKTFHPNALYMKGINKQVIPELIKNVQIACI